MCVSAVISLLHTNYESTTQLHCVSVTEYYMMYICYYITVTRTTKKKIKNLPIAEHTRVERTSSAYRLCTDIYGQSTVPVPIATHPSNQALNCDSSTPTTE